MTLQSIPSRSQRYDAVVVGAGPTGTLVASKLASEGLSVVVLEAGSRFRGHNALENTEANAGRIMWSEARNHVGGDFVVPKTGVGVGGGTLSWLGVMPRFHPGDFRTMTEEGVGVDWPISYEDLRAHYKKVEHEFGLAGECGPFAPEQYSLPMKPHRMNWHAQLLARGASSLGASPFAPPVAINSQSRDGRPACIYCGWCASGCPTGAKATAANTYLPRAEGSGVRLISDSFVNRVVYDASKGRVSGVVFMDAQRNEHRVDARLVILAAHAVETPRLLLLSSDSCSFKEGLANSSGMVGKNFMSHPTWQVFGTFEEPVNAFKGMQMGHVMVQDYYKPNARNGYARGFILVSYMMTPATFGLLNGLSYGQELKDQIHQYAHTAAWWAHAESLPDEHNTVTLDSTMRDSRELPVARVHYQWGDNDVKVAAAARDKASEMMAASGANDVRNGSNYGAHAMGSCRMGHDPASSVVNQYCQSHDVKNLFICDTSVFVTGAGVNPTLTAMAIADRAADYMIENGNRGGVVVINETPISLDDIAAITALASGIIPPDENDSGASAVHAGPSVAGRIRFSPYAEIYLTGLSDARAFSKMLFGCKVQDTNARQMHELLGRLRDDSPDFFRQLRSDVCIFYLSDPGVWQRIGFPGESTENGGYPDFDQPQIRSQP